jgi:hypothetical protein
MTKIEMPANEDAGLGPSEEEVIVIPLYKPSSLKANDKTQELAYKAYLAQYDEHPSYHLGKNSDGTVRLIPNHHARADRPDVKAPKEINPEDSSPYFVITLNKATKKPVLRIFAAPHYFLANKQSSVLASGTLRFKDGKIDFIDDQSGAYHINPGWMSHYQVTNIEKKQYKESLKIIFEAVGLPYHLFQPYFDKHEATASEQKSLKC